MLPTSAEVSGSPVDITFDETDALTNGHPVIATGERRTVNIDKDLNTAAKELDCNHLLILLMFLALYVLFHCITILYFAVLLYSFVVSLLDSNNLLDIQSKSTHQSTVTVN